LYRTHKKLYSHIFFENLHSIRNGEPQTSPAELTQGCSRWLKASYSFLYVEVSSLVLLFACIALWSPTPWMKYAISVASVSFGICIILQTMEFLQPGFLEKPMVGEHSFEKLCSVFLLLWWIFGTGFITFKGERLGLSMFLSKRVSISHSHTQQLCRSLYFYIKRMVWCLGWSYIFVPVVHWTRLCLL